MTFLSARGRTSITMPTAGVPRFLAAVVADMAVVLVLVRAAAARADGLPPTTFLFVEGRSPRRELGHRRELEKKTCAVELAHQKRGQLFGPCEPTFSPETSRAIGRLEHPVRSKGSLRFALRELTLSATMEAMPTVLKSKYPESMTLRLSRETIVTLDDIAEDFGGISRRAAIEILSRFAKRVKNSSGQPYSDLMISDAIPETLNRNGHRKSRG